jgi:hypothetical protein
MTPQSKARVVCAGVLLYLMALSPVISGMSDCASADNRTRVACQAQQRRNYGADLEWMLVKQEKTDARVFVEEAGEPGSGGYPRLIIWTVLTRDKADQLNAKAKILEGARAVGFRTLVYIDKAEVANIYFNLTRPGRVPLDVVPWQVLPWDRKP